MILTGLIRDIFPEEAYAIPGKEKPFRKRLLWLSEIGAQYPNVWAIEFWNDDGSRLDNFSVGNKVSINFEVKGKLSTKNGEERVFNTIRGIKIQRLQ